MYLTVTSTQGHGSLQGGTISAQRRQAEELPQVVDWLRRSGAFCPRFTGAAYAAFAAFAALQIHAQGYAAPVTFQWHTRIPRDVLSA